MFKSGQHNIELNQLSSAASSNTTSREQSQDKNHGRNQNRKGRRRSLTPYKNKNNKSRNELRLKTKQRSTSKQRQSNSRRTSRSTSRGSVLSNRSYYKQTNKRQAWKSKICKYWKRGQCKYGDQCEWQHYDFTQINYCETSQKERYNQTHQDNKYLVQITTAAYLTEEEIMTLIGNPTQLRQSIAIAVKNKKQSKLMKKEIIKELRKGQFNGEQKTALKKAIIRKNMQNMQVDIANQLAIKKIEKKEKDKLARKNYQMLKAEKKKRGEDEMIPEIDNQQQINQSDISKTYDKQQQFDMDDIHQNAQQLNNVIQKYVNQKQNTQQENNKQDNIFDQQNNTDQESSNLYFEKPITQNIQISNSKQQQQAIINTIKQDSIQDLKPGRYQIKKKEKEDPSQFKIQNFFNKQTDQELLQGTGKNTLLMEENELKQYYDVTNVNNTNVNLLIQCVASNHWTQELKQAVNSVPMEKRDKAPEEDWYEAGVVIVNINTGILNQMLSQSGTTGNPLTFPAYKARQAIISAILRYLENVSDHRTIFSSQRMQIFILNRIIEGQLIVKDTFWITGMDTRAKAEITGGLTKAQCLVIKFN